MSRMSAEEYWEFMMEGTRTGMLATVRKDGRPHVAPIWFVLDGDDLVFNTGRNTVKGQAVRREGRAALSVDDPTPPYAFVTVEGSVSYEDCAGIPEESLKWPLASPPDTWARTGPKRSDAATPSPESCSSGSPRRRSCPTTT